MEIRLSFNGQSEIRLRSYNNNINPITEEIAVSQQNEINESPRVAMNEENNIIVVWASLENDFDIKGRLFFNSSTNSEEFFINSTIEHAQTNPDVAIWENGDFFVVWESWYQDGSDRGIYGRKFYANGLPATDEILINSNTVYSQAKPSISIMPNNSFVVTWESWGQDQNNSYGIYGQVFLLRLYQLAQNFKSIHILKIINGFLMWLQHLIMGLLWFGVVGSKMAMMEESMHNVLIIMD